MFESKINRGRANGYAPLGSTGKVPLEYLPPIQSTIDSGSFATTGSNTFTGVQTLSGTSGTSWAEFTIGQTGEAGYSSYDLRATGSSQAGVSVTSDVVSLFGVITNEGFAGDVSTFANTKYGFPYSDGPIAAISVQKSGSEVSNWIFNYDGKNYFPSDITIGYQTLGNGLTSGSLNVTNGNINVSGSIFVSGNIYANNLTGSNGTNGTSGTSPFAGVNTGSFATTGSNIFRGNQNIIGNINLSGSLNISSSMIISSTVVNNGTINALNSDLIIDGGDIILSGSQYISGSVKLSATNDNSDYLDLIIGRTNTFGLDGYQINASGSTENALFLLSNLASLIAAQGTVSNPGDTSVFATQVVGYANNGGPEATLLLNTSGSVPTIWVYDYNATSNFPGNINIGYDNIIGTTSGSLNIRNGNINLSGSLILSSSNIPTNLTGSLGDINGTIKIDNNSIYYCSGSFVPETYQIIVNQGMPYPTHVSIPKNQLGVPNLYSNGFSITTSGNTTYVLTGVYSDGDNWDCEIDNLNSNYLGGTQTMTLTWLDYEPINIWTKTDFGFERGKFATTGSNIFYGNQTIVSNVTFPSSSFISTTNASGGLFLSALNQGTLQLNADGGEGDVIIGRSGWDGKLIVNGNQLISGSINIKKPIISIGDSFEGGKVAYILQSGDIGYDPTLIQGIIASESDEIQLLNFANANAACDIKTTNGYSDWVLPGLNELDILYTNKVAIGGFTNNDYWSSLESQSGLVAWFQNFSNGSQDQGAENYQAYVRAIRFFSISKETALNVDGDIILSGSLIQQVNYAPFASSSHSGATTLDITKDIHLLDVTGIETDNHWILPDGLYDGQVVKFALKGDGTANPNGIYIWLNRLRSTLGITRYNYSWSPFWDDSGGSARSLATAVYVDGAWNIDNGFYNLD